MKIMHNLVKLHRINFNQLNLANLENLQGNTMDTKSFKLSSRRNPKDVNLIYNP